MSAAPDALSRRARSHARLEADGIPYEPALVTLPGEAEAAPLLADERDVLGRALALTLVASVATGVAETITGPLIAEYRLENVFSPAEHDFVAGLTPEKRVDFSWRFEAAVPLYWALGLLDALPPPGRQTEPFTLLQRIVPYPLEALGAQAALRPLAELLDAADLAFCHEWASREALVRGAPAPEGVDGGVAVERYRAFSWLIGTHGPDWDRVVATA